MAAVAVPVTERGGQMMNDDFTLTAGWVITERETL